MSLQNYLTANDVINSIHLQLRHPLGLCKIWIIVEGETDQKLFSKLIDGDHVEIEISYGGVGSLLNVVSELLKETDYILGIRDADFIHLENKTILTNNIFFTDFHDAEMMLIACDNAYKAVVAEYLHNEKNPIFLREKLLKSIVFIGGLRWINDSENIELNFQDIGIGVFYDGKICSLDEVKCLQEVIKRSPKKKKDVSREEVINKIKNISDFLNLCNGHDFQRVFARYVSVYSKKGVSDKEIGKSFRIAYRFEDFQQTNLYKQLKEWSDNKSIALFKRF